MNKDLLKIKEHSSDKYTPRTYYNAKSADLTVAFAVNLNTAGEKCTHKAAGDKYIGFLLNDESDTVKIAFDLFNTIKKNNVKSLNIAGNGIYTLSQYGCDQDFINYFVYNIIAKVHEHYKIEKIYTGGQTGVDLAGAVAGYLLNINTEVTLPLGYIQRFENKIDVKMNQNDILNQIENGANLILTRNKTNNLKIR